MKKTIINLLGIASITLLMSSSSCEEGVKNTSALDEQKGSELNQRNFNKNQPAPKLSYSLERENLIKRFLLQNDRTVMFYMYIFIEGDRVPIGYYQVNKVSSVNSQLTNPEQIISGLTSGNNLPSGTVAVIPSPAEDGSYGTNGDAVFGFTPEDIYIEHNMKYISCTVPLSFKVKPDKLLNIDVKTLEDLKILMDKIKIK